MIEIYPYEERGYAWACCYLDGDAENVFNQPNNEQDLFVASCSMPKEPGTYPCTINGHAAVVVLGDHLGSIGGRVVLVSDMKALKHALDVDSWI